MNVIHLYVEFTSEDQVEPLCEDIADVLVKHGFDGSGDALSALISVKRTPVNIDDEGALAKLAMDDSSFILLVGAHDSEDEEAPS